MIIVEKTEGKKISVNQMGENLIVLGDAVYLNLTVYERDFPVSLDFCRNEYGMLTMGLARSYVAQIVVPAREYIEVDTGEIDEEGNPVKEMQAQSFDMNKVTITLWGGK